MLLSRIRNIRKHQRYLMISTFATLGFFLSAKIYTFFKVTKFTILAQKRRRKPKKHINLTKLLDKAHRQHLSSLYYQETAQHYFNIGYIIHPQSSLREAAEDIIGNVASARKFQPCMDETTFTNLNKFCGKDENTKRALCNFFLKKIGVRTSLGRFAVISKMATSNPDFKRIAKEQRIIKALINDKTGCLQEISNIYNIVAESDMEKWLTEFFVRDQIRTSINGLFNFVNSVVSVDALGGRGLFDIIKNFGWDPEAWAKEGSYSMLVLTVLTLPFTTLEQFIQVNSITQDFEYNKKHINDVMNLKGPNTEFSKSALGRIISTVYGYTLGSLLGLFSLGITDVPGVTWLGSKLSGAYLMISILPTFMRVTVQYFFKRVDMFRSAYYNNFGPNSRYKKCQMAHNQSVKVLNEFLLCWDQMKLFYERITKNPELAKECANYIEPIRYFIKNKKFHIMRYLVREIRQLPEGEMTLLQAWWQYGRIAHVLGLANTANSMSKREKEQEAFRNAFLAFLLMEPYFRIAQRIKKDQQTKAKRGFTFVELLPSDKGSLGPHIEIEGGYSLFIPAAKVVENDYKNVINPKTGKEMITILRGLNGAGKSSYLSMIIECVDLGNTYGISPAKKISLEPIHYVCLNNNTSDIAGKRSLMQQELYLMDKNFLDLSDRMQKGEKFLAAMDETYKATNTKEGGYVFFASALSLAEQGNTTVVASTHIDSLEDVSRLANYKNISFFTPGYDVKNDDFTFKIHPGASTQPVCLKAIKKQKFHPPTTEKIEQLMANDPTYAFRNQVGKAKEKTFFTKVMTSCRLQYFLLLLLVLLIGMLLGSLLNQKQSLPSRPKTKEIRN